MKLSCYFFRVIVTFYQINTFKKEKLRIILNPQYCLQIDFKALLLILSDIWLKSVCRINVHHSKGVLPCSPLNKDASPFLKDE